MIRFANEELLYLLALIPAFIFFYYLVFRWKRHAMQRFGNLELVKRLSLSTSRKRQIGKVALLIAALFFMILALARPQVGSKLEEVKREGVDVFIALDVSASMDAQDLQPSRVDKARHELGSLIDRLQGDRVGLIAFAGKAFVQCPLTLDYGAAKMFLDHLEPGIIPEPGTNIGAAIEQAMKSFSAMERKYKVLVLITDGEGHDEDPLKMAEAAEREGVVIYTVGIGSPKGVPIPVYDERDVQTGFKKDRRGEVVVTKLDEVTLEKIALQTGGKYYRATSGESELDRIYDAIAGMEKKDLASLQYSQYEDRFQYPLVLALLLCAIEPHLSERRRSRKGIVERWQAEMNA